MSISETTYWKPRTMQEALKTHCVVLCATWCLQWHTAAYAPAKLSLKTVIYNFQQLLRNVSWIHPFRTGQAGQVTAHCFSWKFPPDIYKNTLAKSHKHIKTAVFWCASNHTVLSDHACNQMKKILGIQSTPHQKNWKQLVQELELGPLISSGCFTILQWLPKYKADMSHILFLHISVGFKSLSVFVGSGFYRFNFWHLWSMFCIELLCKLCFSEWECV